MVKKRNKKQLIKELEEISRDRKRFKDRLSMIEYKLRNYEETNGNPFTLIRDIKNIIRGVENDENIL